MFKSQYWALVIDGYCNFLARLAKYAKISRQAKMRLRHRMYWSFTCFQVFGFILCKHFVLLLSRHWWLMERYRLYVLTSLRRWCRSAHTIRYTDLRGTLWTRLDHREAHQPVKVLLSAQEPPCLVWDLISVSSFVYTLRFVSLCKYNYHCTHD